MSDTRTALRAAYAIVAATDTLLAGSGSPAGRTARRLTKPALMPLLLAGTLVATPGRKDRLRAARLAAQALSRGDDVALLGTSERAFLSGVASFFGAHVAYIAGFSPTVRGGMPPAPGSRRRAQRRPGRRVTTAAALWLVPVAVMATYTAGQWLVAEGVSAAG